MKKIDLNKFYLIHDGSPKGHPALLVWKDDKANLYKFVKFGSTANKDNTPLDTPISSDVKHSFVYKRPLVLKRKNIGKELLKDIEINKGDLKKVMIVSNKDPLFSKDITRKDKKLYKFLMKIIKKYKKTAT